MFPSGIADKKINSYVITLDDAENALRPVLTYVETLLDHPGAEYFLERRVFFPTIPGSDAPSVAEAYGGVENSKSNCTRFAAQFQNRRIELATRI